MTEDTWGVISFIGVGANLGDPSRNCLEAIDRISRKDGIGSLRWSSLYRTEPVGLPNQPWFVNAAVEIRTVLAARDLLNALKTIERDMGRTDAPRGGSRVIDLDILLFGQEVVHEPDLIIPHPAFHLRRFALLPVFELASYVIHPSFGVSISGLIDRLEDRSAVELLQ